MEFDKDEQQKLVAEISGEMQKLEEQAFRRRQTTSGPRGWLSRFFVVAGEAEDYLPEKEKSPTPPPPPPPPTEHTTTPQDMSHLSSEAISAAIAKGDELPNPGKIVDGQVTRTRATSTPPATPTTKPPPLMREAPLKREEQWRDIVSQHARRRHRQPISQRWWFPWVCIGAIVLIWIPDRHKVQGLMWLDVQHEQLKHNAHLWYWKMTMPPDQYELLLKQIEANTPKELQVESSKCPL